MSGIDEMLKSFVSEVERSDFIRQQHVTIMNLTKKINDLEEKNNHLENLLEKNIPSLVQNNNSIVSFNEVITDYEENICRMELKRLHDLTMERGLTYEETKKVDIYTKLLIQLNSKPKTIELEAKNKNTTELLALVENADESNRK